MAHDTTTTRDLLNAAYRIGRDLGRKFDASDVAGSATLMQAASAYASAYQGAFSYMREMHLAAMQGFLTVGQAKGVLNCLMAEAKRNCEARKATPAATTTAPRSPSVALDMTKVADGRYRVVLADSSSISVRILTGVWDEEPASRQIAVLADGQKWFGLGKALENGTYTLWRKAADQAPRVREALTVLANAGDDLVYRLAYALAGSQCSFCGLELDTDESITAGYGPTCAAKRDLPWGKKAEVPASVLAARAAAAAMVAGQVPAPAAPVAPQVATTASSPAPKGRQIGDQLHHEGYVTLGEAKARGYRRTYREVFGNA